MHGLILQSPGATFFSIGPFTIRWYGIMIALGFLTATYAATRMAKQWGLDGEKIINLLLVCFVGGIIGARLYFVALSWSYFSTRLSEIVMTWNEGFSIRGLSIHGGIFGALIAGYLYCRKAKLPFWTCCDLIACVLPLGQAIGRWGNFFNSEAFGKPAPEYFPVKLFIPQSLRPINYTAFEYFHATFLYECVWDLALFAVLYFIAGPRLRKMPGLTFFMYLAGYSIGRLLIEPIRTDSIMMLGMPAPSIVSAVLLAIALGAVAFILIRARKAVPSETAQSQPIQAPDHQCEQTEESQA